MVTTIARPLGIIGTGPNLDPITTDITLHTFPLPFHTTSGLARPQADALYYLCVKNFGCPRKVRPCIGRTGCGTWPQIRPQACGRWHQTKCCGHWHRPYAQMGELARFRKHRISNLAQCVDFSDHSVKHYGHMLVGIKALYVAFTIILAAEFENFFLVEQIY